MQLKDYLGEELLNDITPLLESYYYQLNEGVEDIEIVEEPFTIYSINFNSGLIIENEDEKIFKVNFLELVVFADEYKFIIEYKHIGRYLESSEKFINAIMTSELIND